MNLMIKVDLKALITFSILRIFKLNSSPPISLLNPPLIVNEKKLLSLKIQSINYLKKNLNQ